MGDFISLQGGCYLPETRVRLILPNTSRSVERCFEGSTLSVSEFMRGVVVTCGEGSVGGVWEGSVGGVWEGSVGDFMPLQGGC